MSHARAASAMVGRHKPAEVTRTALASPRARHLECVMAGRGADASRHRGACARGMSRANGAARRITGRDTRDEALAGAQRHGAYALGITLWRIPAHVCRDFGGWQWHPTLAA